jgi:hypothetical protein
LSAISSAIWLHMNIKSRHSLRVAVDELVARANNNHMHGRIQDF